MRSEEFRTFPESGRMLSPLELYDSVYSTISIPRDEVFFSHPITSAGVREFIFNNDDIAHDAKITSTIVGNNSLAKTLVSSLGTTIDSLKSLPGNLGAREGWEEFDYNRFWFYFITGIDTQSAVQFERMAARNSGDNSNPFNDYHGDRTTREELYNTFVEDFINFVKYTDSPINPVSKIIFLPDSHDSLGCRMERKLADAFDIPSGAIVIDGPDELTDKINLYTYAVSQNIIPVPEYRISDEEKAEFDAIYEEVLLNLPKV